MRGCTGAITAALFAGLVGIGSALAAGTGSDQPPVAIAPEVQDDGLLPQNYRRFVALKILPQYLSDGDGEAEISQPRSVGLFRKTPQFVVRFRLSLTGAHGMLFTFRDPPPRRYRCIDVEADRGMFSDKPFFRFRHPRNDPGEICDTNVAFEPFTELEQMAGRARGCIDRGDKQCVIADAVAKPDDKAAAPAKRKRVAKPAE